MSFFRTGLGLIFMVVGMQAAGRVEIAWPTPSAAWRDGRSPAEFLQQAGSGDPMSGSFGGVRSSGLQFHEGIDIKCDSRDRRGEPADNIFAAMDGVVRHISQNAGESNYGRYIVLEHPDNTPAVYSLYAHLSRIAPGLKPGDRVTRGQVIGVMGHSGSQRIPRDRAHLHFEIGVMVTRDFQSWYNGRKFGSSNEHGMWNGMNLMGIDPLAFFNQWRERRVNTFQDYFSHMEPEVTVTIATQRVPDFVLRYPALLTKPLPSTIGGWEIKFNWTGIPFEWKPLSPLEVMGLGPEQPILTEVNVRLAKQQRSRVLVVERRGRQTVGRDLQIVLQQLFGLR